jgi:hypothetical protein
VAIGKADIGMAIVAQRIMRRKGSEHGTVLGKVHTFPTLSALREHCRNARHVYLYLADGGEGAMRSGAKMRPVDSNVRNTVKSRIF